MARLQALAQENGSRGWFLYAVLVWALTCERSSAQTVGASALCSVLPSDVSLGVARMHVSAVSFPGERPGLSNIAVFGPGIAASDAEVLEVTVVDMNAVWDGTAAGRLANRTLTGVQNANTWMGAGSYITNSSSAKVVFSGGKFSGSGAFPKSGLSFYLPGNTPSSAVYPELSTLGASIETRQPVHQYRYGSMLRLSNHLISAGGLSNGQFRAIEIMKPEAEPWKYVSFTMRLAFGFWCHDLWCVVRICLL